MEFIGGKRHNCQTPLNSNTEVLLHRNVEMASRFTVNLEHCDLCGKTVYAAEKTSVDGKILHKAYVFSFYRLEMMNVGPNSATDVGSAAFVQTL